MRLFLSLTSLLCVAACSSGTTTDAGTPDSGRVDSGLSDSGMHDSGPSDAAIDASACGAMPSALCTMVLAGGGCDDTDVPQVCTAGTWQCPPGMVLSATCACHGAPPPSCTCTPTGFSCDGGTPDAATSDAGDIDAGEMMCSGDGDCTGAGEVCMGGRCVVLLI